MNGPQGDVVAAHAEVKAEIARTDNKTGLLLAFVGAVLAGGWSVGHGLTLTWPARIIGGTGMAVLLVAAGLLLWAVRPNLSGRHGFPLWATLTAEEITTVVAGDLAADVAGLSRLAVKKFTALRRAVDLTLAGGALLIAAVLLAFGDVA
ncbi:integral membrane plasmid transfer protein [Streptomyces sp. J2-1]|uniref:Pycsar system effector family protein n=1 Tax=Streptomyces corallincola TaxID=2851888 RepID=UPI001C38625E|nr:Pycsar system effector family protein [Streptomyces corallincola]MBV2358113.1 integral membrane plasmid transfer protein [Streptomyces corallincola]